MYFISRSNLFIFKLKNIFPNKQKMNLILFCFLFFSHFTRNNSKTLSCHSCCSPTQPLRILPLAILLPFIFLLFLGAFLWFKKFRISYLNRKRANFDHFHNFQGKLPLNATFDYLAYSSTTSSLTNKGWVSRNPVTFTFNDLSLRFQTSQTDAKKKTICLEGPIQNHSKALIKSEQNQELNVYFTALPFEKLPGIFGFSEQKKEELLMFLPNRFKHQIWKLFPAMNNKFLKIYIGSIFLLSFICMITYNLIRMSKFYPHYLIGLVGCPWGAIASFFGIFLMFFFANPFGWVFVRMKYRGFLLLCFIFVLIEAVCLGFASIDLMTADFLIREQMINTQVDYEIEREEIPQICDFSHFECSVYWNHNLTKRNEDCLDGYYLLCISFNKNAGSCEKGAQNIYEMFIFQGIFQGLLGVFWSLALMVMIDVFFFDKWTPVEMKIEEWNHNANEREIEMNMSDPLEKNEIN